MEEIEGREREAGGEKREKKRWVWREEKKEEREDLNCQDVWKWFPMN